MRSSHPKDPLHGVTLETIVRELVDRFGWGELGRRVPVRCFTHNPSIKSSLTFLRKTPWARTKVEELFVRSQRRPRKAAAVRELPPATIVELHHVIEQVRAKRPAILPARRRAGQRCPTAVRVLLTGGDHQSKALAAELFARELKLRLQRVDLSALVNKYLGETEKHLGDILAAAEHADAVLFFDEADALFGRRTASTAAHDRYANLEVAYLAQRIEEHPGLVILATNHRDDLDVAFTRRFGTVITLPRRPGG